MRYVMLLAMVCACGPVLDTNPDLEEFEAVLRSGQSPFPAQYPGNGDLAVYEGASTASEDCLIYTTQGTEVYAGRAPAAPLVFTVDGNDLVDPDGNVTCTIESNLIGGRIRNAGDGEVVFTVIGRWVFDGEINLNQPLLQILAQFEEQLTYTFQTTHIYEHTPWTGAKLATATTAIALANPARKLVLSSLIAGECGGLGLYADEDEDEDEAPHEP